MPSTTFKTTSVTDTFLESDDPTTNFNTDARLIVGELNIGALSCRTLIKFPLDDGTIPSGSVINSATLRLYLTSDYSDNATDFRVHRMLRSWSETQATWDVYTTGNNWGTAGAGNTSTDREATTLGTRAFTSTETLNVFVEWTLTASAVQEMIAGGVFTNNGFLIEADDLAGNDDGYGFASNASGTSAHDPELVVDYTPSTAAAGLPIMYA